MYIYINIILYVIIKNMGRPKIQRVKVCETCKKEFDAGNKKNKKNCSEECTELYKKNHKEERMKKTFESIEKKYGKKSFFQTDNYYYNLKKIKKEKYGDENYNNYEKIKSSLKEKYDVEHPSQIKDYKEKSDQTKLSKYNDPNFNNREKAKSTIKEKYNVDHHLQTKESLDKLKQTNREKYGVDYTVQTNECRDNLKKLNQERFKSDYYFSSDLYLNIQKSNKTNKIKEIIAKNDLQFSINENKKTKNIKYQLTCNLCDNIFEWSFDSIPICRRCYPLTSIAKQQVEFKEFLNSLKLEYIENTKEIISPLELNFYLEKYNVALQLNGNYFNSEMAGNKLPNYHLRKSQLCNFKDIKLIHIFEDEWMFKKDIVKSRIKNYLNLTPNKIFGRNCKIEEISFLQKKIFLEENHIQGNDVNFKSYGLFYEDKLVSVMTFCKPRLALGNRLKKNENNVQSVELSRFCSKIDYNVIGGFEKLLNHFKKNNPEIKQIFTYADCRWSGLNPEKTVYHKCNFEYINTTKPNYFYFEKSNYFIRYHRFKYNKQKLIKLFNEKPELTEWQIAKKNRMDRIWDCGSMKFVLDL